jgi:ketosteroid isomerase-like protein
VTAQRRAASVIDHAGSPRHLALTFFEALNRGETATAASLFSVNGCFVTPDGTAVAGVTGLRAIFRQMSELGARVEIDSLGCHRAGDVCLVEGFLRYRTGTRNAESVEPMVRPRLVLRRNRPAWELAIVALWGP